MDRAWDAESIGEQLGIESVGTVLAKVEAYCAYEEQRITLTNQSRIVALQQEGYFLLEEGKSLAERLRHAPPPGDVRSRRTAYYWGIAIVLTLAAFVFSALTFDPFRVGWKGYLYCLGIAVATPFLLEQVLEKWKAESLFKGLAATASAAALTSLVLLAVVRGDLFAEEMKNPAPVITFDDAQPQPPAQNSFYDEAAALLRLVMAFLAVAMELGAGLALHEAWRMSSDPGEDWGKLRDRLNEVRRRMVAITFETTMLQNEAPVFAARFWRNFYRAMLTHGVRSAMTKLLMLVLAALVLANGRVLAQDGITLVVAVDLTQSVGVAGPDHTTDFQKNIDAVTRLLAQVPAGSRLTVIGITDKSFAQPDILLSAKIPEDTGYFGERLRSAQSELVRAWKGRSGQLKPRFPHTDIMGALILSGQIFEQHPDSSRKILVIFSDMRHSTPGLDLQSRSTVQTLSLAGTTSGANVLLADLRHVEVYALGVDGAGKTITYWQSLRDFWVEYLRGARANLRTYSVLREMPRLQRVPTR
jgi:hypothetical protein